MSLLNKYGLPLPVEHTEMLQPKVEWEEFKVRERLQGMPYTPAATYGTLIYISAERSLSVDGLRLHTLLLVQGLITVLTWYFMLSNISQHSHGSTLYSVQLLCLNPAFWLNSSSM